MSHCVQKKRGNIFDDKDQQHPPYTGEVERICTDATQDGSAIGYSRQYSSFMSNTKPEDPNAIRQSLLKDNSSNTSILGNVANVIRNVFAPPRRLAVDTDRHAVDTGRYVVDTDRHAADANEPPFVLQEQEWPTPRIEDDEDDERDENDKKSRKEKSFGGRQPRTNKRNSRSLKRKRSNISSQRKPSRRKSKTRKSKNLRSR